MMLRGIVILIVVCASVLRAQARPWYVERYGTDRWLTGTLPPAFTLPSGIDADAMVRLDSVVAAAGARTTYLNGARARFTLNSGGRLSAFATAAPTVSVLPPESMGSQEGQRRYELGVYLTAQRAFWDIIAPFHPDRATIGGRWTDTFSFADSIGSDYTQTFSGTRVSIIVGDTLVDGHTIWIVRDSALVHFVERWPTDEIIGGSTVTLRRDVTGVIRGRALIDPSRTVFVAREDTTWYAGTATQFYPDGRHFDAPVRYERTRRLALVDSTGYMARLAARRTERPNPGAQAAAEALRLRATPPAVRAAVAAQDTAAAMYGLAYGSISNKIDLPTMRMLVAVLADPARAFLYQTPVQYIYGGGYTTILGGAMAALTPDTSRWWCPPDACRLLASQWERATEPRLRDLALTMHLALDPRGWIDTVRRHAAADPGFQLVVDLVRGAGNLGGGASRDPLPPPNATWPVWEQWMNGRNGVYRQFACCDRDTTPTAHPGVRFEDTHLRALRFHQLLTGRDFVDEFQRQLTAAASDTSRLVYRTMLISLGAYRESPADLAVRFLTGTAMDRLSASTEVKPLFQRRPPRADSATTAEIQDRVLAHLFDGVSPWPAIGGGPNGIGFGGGPGPVKLRAGDSVVLLAPDLSPALRATWGARGTLLTGRQARAPNDIPTATFTISAVDTVGPFARVSWSYGYNTPGAAGAPSHGSFAMGGTVYLVRAGASWMILFTEAFIS